MHLVRVSRVLGPAVREPNHIWFSQNELAKWGVSCSADRGGERGKGGVVVEEEEDVVRGDVLVPPLDLMEFEDCSGKVARETKSLVNTDVETKGGVNRGSLENSEDLGKVARLGADGWDLLRQGLAGTGKAA